MAILETHGIIDKHAPSVSQHAGKLVLFIVQSFTLRKRVSRIKYAWMYAYLIAVVDCAKTVSWIVHGRSQGPIHASLASLDP